jgi:uncharacterized protein (DUF2236 family)
MSLLTGLGWGTSSLRQRVVDDLVAQIGRHEEPEVFGGEPGDPGLVGPGSMSWEINGDVASVLIAGVGAIIMEILHPSVVAGVQDLSSYADEPERRARTTFGYVVTTTFGNTLAATRLIDAVKRIHRRVSGTRPDGTPYRALDAELIGWVHTCIPWAIMTAYDRFNRPLSVAERDRYLCEQAVIGRMGGAGEIPESTAELREYVEAMRPKLEVNTQTLDFFEALMSMRLGAQAPGPLARPVRRFQLEAGMSLMPDWARRMTGLETHPLARRTLHEPSLGGYARLVRWASGTPQFRRLAEQRAGAAVTVT